MVIAIVILTTTGVVGLGLTGYALFKYVQGRRRRDRAIATLQLAYAQI